MIHDLEFKAAEIRKTDRLVSGLHEELYYWQEIKPGNTPIMTETERRVIRDMMARWQLYK